ncbi:MAG: ATP-binding protein [Prevotella sp.]|nr:ATP-binding protein [Prevotella sp.]
MKSIILAHRQERDSLLQKAYQPREYQKRASAFMASPLIKLITGPRRAGKSVFALLLLKEKNFAYLNFDDEKLLGKFDEDAVMQALQEVYPGYEYLMLDEIQNLDHWDLWVSKLYRRGHNLLITGSNAKLLSSEMGTVLTGRFVEMEILPFSLTECLNYRQASWAEDLPDERATLMLQVSDYMHYGGYPEIINSREITESYLHSLFDSIILKDIAKRYKIRKTTELYQLATYLVSMFCSPFTFSTLAEELSFSSKSTLQKFCAYLEQTYLFFYLPRYNNKLKLMQKAPQKAYIVDNGFLVSSAFQTSENRGRLLENLVFLELLRRKNKVSENIFYYHSRNNRETDFVLREKFQIVQLIQVCYDMTAPKTAKREVDSIMECAAELKCDNMLIITWEQDTVIEKDDKRITVLPFHRWCKAYSD